MIGKELLIIKENADTAVLFIHGILGTPLHFSHLLPLVPESFSVCNIVLDGHGKGVRDFSRTSMKKWEAQAESVFQSLAKTHKNIIVVGHSMGTLLAMELSTKHPEKVKSLFLLNVPLTPRTAPASARHTYRVLFEKVREDRADEVAARNAYGIEIDRRLWLYIPWIPRFIELFRKAHSTKKLLPQISVPCRTFQSRKDELVSNRSEKLLRRHKNITVTAMDKSSHYLYEETDKEIIRAEFLKECQKFI